MSVILALGLMSCGLSSKEDPQLELVPDSGALMTSPYTLSARFGFPVVQGSPIRTQLEQPIEETDIPVHLPFTPVQDQAPRNFRVSPVTVFHPTPESIDVRLDCPISSSSDLQLNVTFWNPSEGEPRPILPASPPIVMIERFDEEFGQAVLRVELVGIPQLFTSSQSDTVTFHAWIQDGPRLLAVYELTFQRSGRTVAISRSGVSEPFEIETEASSPHAGREFRISKPILIHPPLASQSLEIVADLPPAFLPEGDYSVHWIDEALGSDLGALGATAVREATPRAGLGLRISLPDLSSLGLSISGASKVFRVEVIHATSSELATAFKLHLVVPRAGLELQFSPGMNSTSELFLDSSDPLNPVSTFISRSPVVFPRGMGEILDGSLELPNLTSLRIVPGVPVRMVSELDPWKVVRFQSSSQGDPASGSLKFDFALQRSNAGEPTPLQLALFAGNRILARIRIEFNWASEHLGIQAFSESGFTGDLEDDDRDMKVRLSNGPAVRFRLLQILSLSSSLPQSDLMVRSIPALLQGQLRTTIRKYTISDDPGFWSDDTSCVSRQESAPVQDLAVRGQFCVLPLGKNAKPTVDRQDLAGACARGQSLAYDLPLNSGANLIGIYSIETKDSQSLTELLDSPPLQRIPNERDACTLQKTSCSQTITANKEALRKDLNLMCKGVTRVGNEKGTPSAEPVHGVCGLYREACLECLGDPAAEVNGMCRRCQEKESEFRAVGMVTSRGWNPVTESVSEYSVPWLMERNYSATDPDWDEHWSAWAVTEAIGADYAVMTLRPFPYCALNQWQSVRTLERLKEGVEGLTPAYIELDAPLAAHVRNATAPASEDRSLAVIQLLQTEKSKYEIQQNQEEQ